MQDSVGFSCFFKMKRQWYIPFFPFLCHCCVRRKVRCCFPFFVSRCFVSMLFPYFFPFFSVTAVFNALPLCSLLCSMRCSMRYLCILFDAVFLFYIAASLLCSFRRLMLFSFFTFLCVPFDAVFLFTLLSRMRFFYFVPESLLYSMRFFLFSRCYAEYGYKIASCCSMKILHILTKPW